MKREDVLRKGPYPMLIDGREVPSQSRKTFASVDPSTGQKLAEVAKSKGVTKLCFDRGHYKFHGRVKALAEAAREGGLKF